MTDTTLAEAGAAAENLAPEAVETPEVTTPETEAQQQPQDTADAEHGDGADKSIKRLERRISRVTAARYQAEAEARQLRERLEAIERAQTQPQDDPQQIRPEDIDRIATERAREMAQAQTVAARSNSTFEAGIKAYGDAFRESIAEVIEEAGPLIAGNGMPTALGEAVLDSEKPAELLHHLGQNPDIAETLRGLSPAALGRRIARIEAEMSKPKAPPPKPLKPVTTAGGGATLGRSASDMTDAEWYAQRRGR